MPARSRLPQSVPLDLLTLEYVKTEVASRARDWKSAYRLNPISAGAAATHDPRLVRAEELTSLERWLVEQIAHADAELDRVALTDAGARAVEVAS
jgi:hypothetical protein